MSSPKVEISNLVNVRPSNMPPLPNVNGSANDGSGNDATLPCLSGTFPLSPIEIGFICDALI